MKKTAKIILVSAGAAMLMAGSVLGAVAVYDTAAAKTGGDIVVKTEHVNLVWGEDGNHEQDKFEVAITDLNTTPTDRYLSVAIAPEEGHTLAEGTYKGTLAFSIASNATDSMILPKLAVEVAEDGTTNKVSMGTDYKANLVVELTETKTSALVKISYKLTENFGELTQEELNALAAEKLTATADWNIYSETPAPEPVIEDGYYLVGEFNKVEKWDLADGTKMSEEDVGTDHAKLLNVELKKDDKLRVMKHQGETNTWCLTGADTPYDGNYVVAKDGTYNIYVNKDDEVWVSEVEEPEPTVEKEWYLVGSFGETADQWKVKEANKLEEVTENVPDNVEKQYKITKLLAENVEFKIRDNADEDNKAVWSNALEANVVGMAVDQKSGNIKVSAEGTYDIYFKILKDNAGYSIWAGAQA